MNLQHGKEDPAKACYEPTISIGAIDATERFDKGDFYEYMLSQFGVSEKLYEPLKDLLAAYHICPEQILGTDYPDEANRADLALFEKAKLTVLVRRMSQINKKWRSQVMLSKPSMSAALGSSAPSSSVYKREMDEMFRHYISQLKEGVPASRLASAKPLFESTHGDVFEGGNFEWRASSMMKYVSDFLAGRQRELLVAQNHEHGWSHPEKGYAFWPSHVSPAFGAPEAVDTARRAFAGMLDVVPPDAHKDMARVRLLKDFFLDAESSYWRESHELNKCLQEDLPQAIGKLDLRTTRAELPEKIAQAFDVEASELPSDLVAQAEYLVRLYGLKHCPFEVGRADAERLDYFKKMEAPHYTALAAMILFHLQATSRKIKLTVPGDTYGWVYVHKAFRDALKAAGVELGMGAAAKDSQLVIVLRDMDTKALTYITSLFSVASMADDGETQFLRMDYLGAHVDVKVERTAMLAELPQRLKAYSCEMAFQLMGDFMSCLQECTYNPLV